MVFNLISLAGLASVIPNAQVFRYREEFKSAKYFIYYIKTMSITKTYERFAFDDFNQIQEEFKRNGFEVNAEDDFCTYQGWKEKGRKVRRGSTGIKIASSNSYSQPLFRMGHPLYDEEGKRKFAFYPKSFVLFHREQTKELKV